MLKVARTSIEVAGLDHGGQPIPLASRVGNILMTGGVAGLEPGTHRLDADGRTQCDQLFRNLEAILAAAGAAPANVVRLTFYVRDRSLRDAINEQWVAMFPDEHARPARHTIVYDHLPPGVLLQCDALAVLE